MLPLFVPAKANERVNIFCYVYCPGNFISTLQQTLQFILAIALKPGWWLLHKILVGFL